MNLQENLDPDNTDIVMKLFREINARGTTVLIATHDENLYRGTGQRVFYIEDRHIDQEFIG